MEKYQEYLQAVKEYQEYERKIKAKIVSLKTVMQEEGVQEELKAELQQMEKTHGGNWTNWRQRYLRNSKS